MHVLSFIWNLVVFCGSSFSKWPNEIQINILVTVTSYTKIGQKYCRNIYVKSKQKFYVNYIEVGLFCFILCSILNIHRRHWPPNAGNDLHRFIFDPQIIWDESHSHFQTVSGNRCRTKWFERLQFNCENVHFGDESPLFTAIHYGKNVDK